VSRLGAPRLHLRRTGSTNDRARELAQAGAPDGTLVTATEQTAGRGRGGRTWSAPAGSGLLMSLLVRWPQGAQPPALLPLVAAVAICDVAGERARIKWPNDVVIEQGAGLAKLAGILTEARPQECWAILGIGLNVAVDIAQLPSELQAGAPRAAATMGLPASALEPTLQQLLAALERRLAEPAQDTLEAWRARDALRGREIAWGGGHGRADGIDGSGRLVVALADGGRTTLSAGEVHLRAVGPASG
jgi:BirA family transcriptional regulator, biotin operon repressor / biotin---[acetyl-CoA-carboxylase] ligase